MHTDQLIYFMFLLTKKFNGKNIYDIGSTNQVYISSLC